MFNKYARSLELCSSVWSIITQFLNFEQICEIRFINKCIFEIIQTSANISIININESFMKRQRSRILKIPLCLPMSLTNKYIQTLYINCNSIKINPTKWINTISNAQIENLEIFIDQSDIIPNQVITLINNLFTKKYLSMKRFKLTYRNNFWSNNQNIFHNHTINNNFENIDYLELHGMCLPINQLKLKQLKLKNLDNINNNFIK